MSRKHDRRRRKRRRERGAAAELVTAVEGGVTGVDWSRLQKRYERMQARGAVFGLVSLGITVDARAPAEMVENTDRAIIQGARKMRST